MTISFKSANLFHSLPLGLRSEKDEVNRRVTNCEPVSHQPKESRKEFFFLARL